jgi:pyridoxamine 5'-phosphate oxidase
MDLRNYRQQYNKGDLERDQLDEDPFIQFEKLFSKAKEAGVSEPNAMTLATYDEHFGADARIVLLKEVVRNEFVFFTNYLSSKGQQLTKCPHATLLFWWPQSECQIRIRGHVERIDPAESDAYFYSRPHDSKAGAISSQQSCVVEDYDELMKRFEEIKALPDEELERPEHWGGFAVIPKEFEFWQGRPNRMHDRFLYQLVDNHWVIKRLSP